jgi:hypothetical protein
MPIDCTRKARLDCRKRVETVVKRSNGVDHASC